MFAIARSAPGALLLAGVLSALAPGSSAGAQRNPPRMAVGSLSRPEGADRGGRHGDGDHDRDGGRWHGERRIRGGNTGTVIYLPADGESLIQQSGIYYPEGVYVAPGIYASQGVVVGQGVYATRGGMGMVYDASGRPVLPSYSGGPGGGGYTPDLSGTPYVVVAGGVMLVDTPNGQPRSVPSCAAQRAARDHSGKPRTIFYQPTDYGLVLREGQQGRVQVSAQDGTATCYGIDRFGHVALLDGSE